MGKGSAMIAADIMTPNPTIADPTITTRAYNAQHRTEYFFHLFSVRNEKPQKTPMEKNKSISGML